LIQYLLDAAASLGQKDALMEKRNNRGQTALHLASRQGNAQVLTFLVEVGANVSQGDENQNTALHLAASLLG